MKKTPSGESGETFIALSLLVWMSIAVGPWWVGAGLWVAGFLVNLLLWKLED